MRSRANNRAQVRPIIDREIMARDNDLNAVDLDVSTSQLVVGRGGLGQETLRIGLSLLSQETPSARASPILKARTS